MGGLNGGHLNGLGTAFVVHAPRIFLVTTRTSVCIGNKTGTVRCVGVIHRHTNTGPLSKMTAIRAMLSRHTHRLYKRCIHFCSLGHANGLADTCLGRAGPSINRCFVRNGRRIEPFPRSFLRGLRRNKNCCRGPKC